MEQRNRKTYAILLLLAALMIFALFGTAAVGIKYAETANAADTGGAETPVASQLAVKDGLNVSVTSEHGTHYYDSLADAFHQANYLGGTDNADPANNKHVTITMYADFIPYLVDRSLEITDALKVKMGRSITLDLNGHILQRNKSTSTDESTHGEVIFVEGGAFTLTDSSPTTPHTYTTALFPDGYPDGGVLAGGYNIKTNSDGYYVGNGGGINANQYRFEDPDGYSDNNITYSASVTIEGGTIAKNAAVDGAAVYTASSGKSATLTITGGVFSDNENYDNESTNHAAIKALNPIITNAKIINNAASGLVGYNVKISNCEISNNTGIGVSAEENLTVYSSDIFSNGKGGIRTYGKAYDNSQLTVTGSNIYRNGGSGVAICARNSTRDTLNATVRNSKIYENTAEKGGGIFAQVENYYESRNIALNIKNTEIYRNSAEIGGGIALLTPQPNTFNTIEVTVTGGKITGNNATVKGGGVYIERNSAVQLVKMTILHNESGTDTEIARNLLGGTFVPEVTDESGTVTKEAAYDGGAADNLMLGGYVDEVDKTRYTNSVTLGANFNGTIGVTSELAPTQYKPIEGVILADKNAVVKEETIVKIDKKQAYQKIKAIYYGGAFWVSAPETPALYTSNLKTSGKIYEGIPLAETAQIALPDEYASTGKIFWNDDTVGHRKAGDATGNYRYTYRAADRRMWNDIEGGTFYNFTDVDTYIEMSNIAENGFNVTFNQTAAVYVGDSLESAAKNFVARLTFEDGTSRTISPDRLTLLLANGTFAAGDNAVQAKFQTANGNYDGTKNYETQVTVAAQEVIDSAITVAFSQGDVTVYTSDNLDTVKTKLAGNIVVTVYRNNGTSYVADATQYTLSGTINAGNSKLTVELNDTELSKTITVAVTEIAATSITAAYLSSDAVYTSTSLDSLKSNLTVTAHFNDGSTKTVSDYALIGALTAGMSVVTVNYGDFFTTFSVSVQAVAPSNIQAAWTGGVQPTVHTTDSIEYGVLQFITVTGINNDGSTFPISDFTVTGDISSAGEKTLTVSALDMETTISVSVTVSALQSLALELVAEGERPTVYTSDSAEIFKTFITKVTGTNADGSEYNSGNAITDYSIHCDMSAGEQTVTVTFEGVSATFNYTITQAYVVVQYENKDEKFYYDTLESAFAAIFAVEETAYTTGTTSSQKKISATVTVWHDLVLETGATLLSNRSEPAGYASTLTIDLNGYVIDRNLTAAANDGSVIRTDWNLTIKDSAPNRAHIGKYASYPIGGIITGGYSAANGGGVYMDMSGIATSYYRYRNFIMTGGTVYKNNAVNNGGGIYYDGYKSESAALRLTDVSILDNCTSGDGGGIYVAGTTFTMTNCTVSGNSAVSGGGIATRNSIAFTAKNVRVYNNSATNNGGGYWDGASESGVTVEFNGCEITGNSAANGGGIYKSYATMSLYGVTISGNTAATQAGGVYQRNGKLTLYGQTAIEGNTVGSNANNLYLYNTLRNSSNSNLTLTLDSTFSGRVGFTFDESSFVSNATMKEPDCVTPIFVAKQGSVHYTSEQIWWDGDKNWGTTYIENQENYAAIYLRGLKPTANPTIKGEVYGGTTIKNDIVLVGSSGDTDGVYEWTVDDGIYLTNSVSAGVQKLSWRFIPSDSKKYTELKGTITVNVHEVATVEVIPTENFKPTAWAKATGSAENFSVYVTYADGNRVKLSDADVNSYLIVRRFADGVEQADNVLLAGKNTLIAYISNSGNKFHPTAKKIATYLEVDAEMPSLALFAVTSGTEEEKPLSVFDTLEDAANYFNDTSKMKSEKTVLRLYRDVYPTTSVAFNRTYSSTPYYLTFDLNGHIIDFSNATTIIYGHYGMLSFPYTDNVSIIDSSPATVHADRGADFPLGGVVTGARGIAAVGAYDGNFTAKFTVSGGTFYDNHNDSDKGEGGAFYLQGVKSIFDGGKIYGNTAKYGGAIYNYFDDYNGDSDGSAVACLTLKGCEIYGNTAKYGGGIYSHNKQGSKGSTGYISFAGVNIYGNAAGIAGGGVYIARGEAYSSFTPNARASILTGTKINGNFVGGNLSNGVFVGGIADNLFFDLSRGEYMAVSSIDSTTSVGVNTDSTGMLIKNLSTGLTAEQQKCFTLDSPDFQFNWTNNNKVCNINRVYQTPTVNYNLGGSLTVGQELPEISLAGGSTAGTIAWEEGQLVDSASKAYYYLFTPDDADTYGGQRRYAVVLEAVTIKEITAAFDQALAGTIYTSAELDALKEFLTVKAVYANDTETTIGDYTLSFVNGSGFVAGVNTIRVSYNFAGTFYQTDFTVTATQVALTDIEVNFSQNREIYETVTKGELKDLLSDDLTVTMLFNDGSRETATSYYLTGDIAAGEQQITVNLGGFRKTITVNFAERKLVSITAASDGYRELNIRDNSLTANYFLPYITVYGRYSNGDKYDREISGFTVAVKDAFRPGISTLVVKYGELETTLTVKVGHSNVEVNSGNGWIGYETAAAAFAAVSGQSAKSAEIILFRDFNESGLQLSVSGKTVILDLNGYILSPASASDSVITVNSGGVLTINDSASERSGGALRENYNVIGGGIRGGKGGIAVNGGTLVMNGGTLFANNSPADGKGGGIFVGVSSKVELKGVKICANSATYGGGIFIETGSDENSSPTVIISGDTQIAGNTATNGSGVYIDNTNSIPAKLSFVGFTGSLSIDAGTVTDGGSYKIGSADSANGIEAGSEGYEIENRSGELFLVKPLPMPNLTISVSSDGTLYVGDSLSKVTLSNIADSATAGAFTFDDDCLIQGKTEYGYTFTPSDKSYRTVKGTVTLSVSQITEIFITFDETKTLYAGNAEKQILAAIKSLRVCYDGHFKQLEEVSAMSAELENGALVVGNNTVGLTYAGYTVNVNVTAQAVVLESINATFDSNNATIYDNATLESLRQYLTVKGTNNDGSQYLSGEAITGYTLSGTLVVGNNTISVTFNADGKTFTTAFNVDNVAALALTGIVIESNPTKTNYTAFEYLDTAGMVVKATFNDGSKVTLNSSDYTLSVTDKLTTTITSVTVSFTYKSVTETASFTVTVSKIALTTPVPNITEFVYDGKEKTLSFGDGFDSLFSVQTGSSSSGTAANTYTAAVEIKDTTNYCWANGFNGEIAWEIKKGTLTVYENIEKGVYDGIDGYGSYVEAEASDNDTPTILYGITEGTYSLSTAPTYTDAGTHTTYYKITLQNYEDVYGSVQTVITKKSNNITASSVPDGWNEWIYGAIPNFPTFTAVYGEVTRKFTGTDNEGKAYDSTETPTAAGSYTLILSVAESQNYTSATLSYQITISRILLDEPTLSKSDYTYNGQLQSAEWSEYNQSLITLTTGGDGKDAGDYNAKFTLTDPCNYGWAEGSDSEVVWKIKKASYQESAVPTVSAFNGAVYDKNKTLADYKLPDGFYWNDPAEVPVSTKTVYSAYYNADTKNYENYLVDVTIEMTKYVVTLPAIESKGYNGQSQTATVAQSAYYTVRQNAGGTNADKYDVVLTLTDDNAVWAEGVTTSEDGKTVTLTFEITPAPVTVTIGSLRSSEGKDFDVSKLFTISGAVYNGDYLDVTLTTSADKNSVGKFAITGTAANKNYDVTFTAGEIEIYSIADYNSFISSYSAIMAKDVKALTFADTSTVSAMSAAYEALKPDTDNFNEFTDEQKQTIESLVSAANAIVNAKTSAETTLKDFAGFDTTFISGREQNYWAGAISAARALVQAYTKLSSGLKESDLDGIANLKTAETLVAANDEKYAEANTALDALKSKTAQGIASGDYTRTSVQELLETAQAAVNGFVSAGGKTEWLTDYSEIARITSALADYDEYAAFLTAHGNTLALVPAETGLSDLEKIDALYAVYGELRAGANALLTQTQKNNIAALKSKADAIAAAKTEAEAALAALDGVTAVKLRDGAMTVDEVNAAIETAEEKVKAFTDISSEVSETDLAKYENIAAAEKAVADYEKYTKFIDGHSVIFAKNPNELVYADVDAADAMNAAYSALETDVADILTDEQKQTISALINKAKTLTEKKTAADEALKDLTDALENGTGKETLGALKTEAEEKIADYIAENGAAADLQDFDAVQGAKDKISEYEKTEVNEQIEKDFGLIADWTDDALGELSIPDLETAIDKAQDTIKKIDATSEQARENLQDTRDKLINLRDRLTNKLTLEKAKETAIAELKAERDKLLASSIYSASAKREIADYYAAAIENVALSTAVADISAHKETAVSEMSSVEPIHIGWLVTDLVFALFVLGEIAYLILRKKTKNKRRGTKTFAIAPLGLLSAVHASGYATGIVFFVLLLIAFVALGIWITDTILKDKKKKSPFAPVTDKVTAMLEKCAAFVKIKKKQTAAESQHEAVRQSDQFSVDEAAVEENTSEPLAKNETENTESEDTETAAVTNDGKRILVRYDFSFRAKLIQSSREVQQRYGEIKGALESVKSKTSWRHERFQIGKKTVAVLVFRGRTLCLALALDPKNLGAKYRGEDMSNVKRYANTPFVLRLNSKRKKKYAIELIGGLLDANGIESGNAEKSEFFLPYRTTEELIAEGLVKVLASEELTDGAKTVKANIADLIREKISMSEAQNAITDEVAAAMIGDLSQETTCADDMRTRPKNGKRGIINVDTLSVNFNDGDTVTLEKLKQAKLIAGNVGKLKILARGSLNKPLTVIADEFSIDAVKMIVLTGGKAIKVYSVDE